MAGEKEEGRGCCCCCWEGGGCGGGVPATKPAVEPPLRTLAPAAEGVETGAGVTAVVRGPSKECPTASLHPTG